MYIPFPFDLKAIIKTIAKKKEIQHAMVQECNSALLQLN